MSNSNWVEGEVIEIKFWNKTLFSIKIKANIESYKAGQFAKLSLNIGDDRVARAYSFVNAPHNDIHEFHLVEVIDGNLTPFIATLNIGDKINISKKSNGFFTMDEVPKNKNLWMLSTGTAIGVFLSILSTKEPWDKYEKIILVQAVRTKLDLVYQELIQTFVDKYPNQFSYISITSRENNKNSLTGRIPYFIKNGELEVLSNSKMLPNNSQIMICGNPEMVKDTQNLLINMNFTKNLKREAGNITTENYW
jgi:ferredoxin--NADP+ reductase